MQPHTIPASGFMRQAQLLGDPKAEPPIPALIPIRSSTLWRWVNSGKFPRPVRLGERVTAWRCEDVQRWCDSQAAAA